MNVFISTTGLINVPNDFLHGSLFFWILLTFGTIILGILIGSICYCCSKLMKKENFIENDHEANNLVK